MFYFELFGFSFALAPFRLPCLILNKHKKGIEKSRTEKEREKKKQENIKKFFNFGTVFEYSSREILIYNYTYIRIYIVFRLRHLKRTEQKRSTTRKKDGNKILLY